MNKPLGIVPLNGCRCRCGHEWIPRDQSSPPKVCPKCKSPNWDSPKLYSRSSSSKYVKTYKLGELFSGAGGIGQGAAKAGLNGSGLSVGISHEWATDYDADACETYKANLCDDDPDKVICKDVRELDLSRLGRIDALAFGFPCNDFSIIGEYKGMRGDFGPLYTYGVKALKTFQPEWFLAENVSGLGGADQGRAFRIILEELEDCGYKLTPHQYAFEKYGVPQARHRIVIIGIRSDLETEFKVPAPTRTRFKTCRAAIESPPIAENAANHEFTNQSLTVIERLKHIEPGQNAFTADLPDNLKLNVKSARMSQIYKRLDPELPAYTITGNGGGGTHVYHWEENRALTNRERARLQTFPDSYVFKGKKESVRKQIGMAVPPLAARIIITAVLKTLHDTPYNFVDPNINPDGSKARVSE